MGRKHFTFWARIFRLRSCGCPFRSEIAALCVWDRTVDRLGQIPCGRAQSTADSIAEVGVWRDRPKGKCAW